MADLRSRFIEDYAGGLLNVSRQELASNGEVLSQDGFLTDSTIYVEDGVGTKSGLRLGVGLAEVVDPTTQTGIVNVRYADRTYTKIRDTKIFTTAIASAQAALAESVTESITNIESAIDYLEIFDSQSDTRISALEAEFTDITASVTQNNESLTVLKTDLEDKIKSSQLGISENNNIRLGLFALSKLENGSSNVAEGFYSLSELYSGNNNIAIGHQSGLNLIEGNNNILIGADSKTTNPRSSNQIILGSPSHDYLWSKTDIYSPALPTASEDSVNGVSVDSTDLLEFVKTLRFNRLSLEKGGSHIVVEPDSLKQAESLLSYKGYVHSESNTISNAKLVPLVLATVSQLLNTLGINLEPVVVNDSSNEGGSSTTISINVPGEGGDLEVKVPSSLYEDLSDPIKNFERKFFPIGGIIMWSNYASRTIPTGWVLCDGQNGTPDLRNKFVIGSGDKYVVGQKKDNEPIVPAHTHTATFNAGSVPVGLPDPSSSNITDVIETGQYSYNVTVGESGERNNPEKTYPPYYVVAFIMRVF